MYKRRKRRTRRRYTGRLTPRRGKRSDIEILLINVFIVLAILLLITFIRNIMSNEPGYKKIEGSLDDLAAFGIPYKAVPLLKELAGKYAISFGELMAIYALENNFFIDELAQPTLNDLEQGLLANYTLLRQSYDPKKIEPYSRIFDSILTDLKYFPIPIGYDTDDIVTFMYGNSWGSSRTYGGARIHKGTDIFDRENQPGRIPIVSMTGGYIQNMGWNELGGYYVGIVTGSGNYYYYAHLNGFAKNIAEGSIVLPGQLIGYMGDTGYGKKEGTSGNFETHLHVGILVDTDLTNKELWINPYPFIRYIESFRVSYVKE